MASTPRETGRSYRHADKAIIHALAETAGEKLGRVRTREEFKSTLQFIPGESPGAELLRDAVSRNIGWRNRYGLCCRPEDPWILAYMKDVIGAVSDPAGVVDETRVREMLPDGQWRTCGRS